MSNVRIAVAGAGLIGRRHLEEIDGSSAAEEVAAKFSVPLYASLAELFGKECG